MVGIFICIKIIILILIFPIDTIFLVYSFKGSPSQPIQLISDKNRILLPLVSILSAYEGLKSIYHGIINNHMHRLYLCDLVRIQFEFFFFKFLSLSPYYLSRSVLILNSSFYMIYRFLLAFFMLLDSGSV